MRRANNNNNVAITNDTAKRVKRTIRRLQFYSEVVVMKLNAAKTNVLHVGYESGPEPLLTLEGTTVDVCDINNKLGLPQLSSKVAIRQRFAAACSSICKLRPIFHSTAPDASKIKLFKSAVEAITAYTLEYLPPSIWRRKILMIPVIGRWLTLH